MRCKPPKEQITAGNCRAVANLSGKEDSGGKPQQLLQRLVNDPLPLPGDRPCPPPLPRPLR